MDRNDFWKIVEIGVGSEEPESILRAELSKLEPTEIESFQEHFDNLFYEADKWKLWGAAYMIGGGCSDDGFIDFRYALISLGKETYLKAVEDPDSLADLEQGVEIDNELFGYVAGEVYTDKTGNQMPFKSGGSQVDMGEEWDFDDIEQNQKHLPRLTKIYW